MRYRALLILALLLPTACVKLDLSNATFSSVSRVVAPDYTSNLVAHWDFENDWIDSVGANNGTPVASTAPTFTSDSFKGSFAADLSSANSRVDVGSSASLTPSNVTVSFWIKRTAASAGSNMIFWAKPCQWDHANGYYVGREGAGKAITLVVSGGNYIGLNGDPDVVFALNTWSHVAATWDSMKQEGHIYVNGVDQPLTTYGTPQVINAASGTDKFIGSCGGGSEIDWPLDDLTIFSSALSASDVQALYQAEQN